MISILLVSSLSSLSLLSLLLLRQPLYPSLRSPSYLLKKPPPLCPQPPRCSRPWTRRRTPAQTSFSSRAGCGTRNTWSPKTEPLSTPSKWWPTNSKISWEVSFIYSKSYRCADVFFFFIIILIFPLPLSLLGNIKTGNILASLLRFISHDVLGLIPSHHNSRLDKDTLTGTHSPGSAICPSRM